MIITGIGEYFTRNAGIVEVAQIRGNAAIGWAPQYIGCTWDIESGREITRPITSYDIIGPYIEPPKLRECWVVWNRNGDVFIASKENPTATLMRGVKE